MVRATGEQRQNEVAMTDGSGRIRDRKTGELEWQETSVPVTGRVAYPARTRRR